MLGPDSAAPAPVLPTIGEIDWNDVRYFLAVARAGSFSQAAGALNTHQSTVSRRIQILEDRLRTRLFARTSQGVVPTLEGEALVAQAERVEAIMFDLKREVAGANTRLTGQVRIGSTDGFGVYWITPRLIELSRAHPELTIDVKCSETDPSLQRLEADIILRLGEEVEEGQSENEILGHMPFRFYAAPAYIARFGRPRSWQELIENHFLVGHEHYPRHTPEWRAWDDLMKRSQRVAYLTNSSAAMVEATVAGLGISFMSGYIHRQQPGLVPLDDFFGADRPTLPIVLVYHPAARRTKRVEVVITYLRQTVQTWLQEASHYWGL